MRSDKDSVYLSGLSYVNTIAATQHQTEAEGISGFNHRKGLLFQDGNRNLRACGYGTPQSNSENKQ